jgi:predicted nucleic acid-binding protein
MGYLIDTDIISELAKPRPDINVLSWADGISLSLVSLSVVMVEELQFGLSWRPNTKVQVWLDRFLEDYCITLPITTEVARLAGEWRGSFQSRGIKRTQADMLIAATAAVHGLIVVTRNVSDFDGCGIAILNPFQSNQQS